MSKISTAQPENWWMLVIKQKTCSYSNSMLKLTTCNDYLSDPKANKELSLSQIIEIADIAWGCFRDQTKSN